MSEENKTEETETPAPLTEEEAVAALREELEMLPGDWYVLHTYSGYEKSVKKDLEARIEKFNAEESIFQIEVPEEVYLDTKGAQSVEKRRVRLPGYAFVRMYMDDAVWQVVRDTPGVTGFVGNAYDPVPLTEEETISIFEPGVRQKAREERKKHGLPVSHEGQAVVTDWEVGDHALVVDGPFKDLHATISAVSAENRRLEAVLNIFGRETPVDLGFDQVEKAE